MGVQIGGRTVKSLRLAGHNASQAYLGTVLVWDGTSPAFVTAKIAIVGVWMPTAGVAASSTIAPPRVSAAAAARSAVLKATAAPAAVRAFAACSVGTATVQADAGIQAAMATAEARAIASLSDATIAAPPALVSAAVLSPAIRTPGSVIALPVTASASVKAPTLSASSSVTASAATGSAAATNPTTRRGASVTAVRAAATATAAAPTVQAINFQNSGLTKSGTQEVASGSTSSPAWTLVTPWEARSGFAGTVIEDNGIRVPAGVTVDITYRVPFSAQPGPSAYTYSRLTNDGVEIPGSVVYNSGYSDAPVLTLTGLVGTGGTVRVEAYGNSSTARRTVTAAAYVEITRA